VLVAAFNIVATLVMVVMKAARHRRSSRWRDARGIADLHHHA
jgi:hypothetical protein